MEINRFKLLDQEGLVRALKMNKHEDIANILENKNINGSRFLQLSERDLVQWNLNFTQKKAVWACINEVNGNPSKYIIKKPSFSKSDGKSSHVGNNFNRRLEGLLASSGNAVGSSRTLPQLKKPTGNPDSPGVTPSTIPRLVPRPRPPIPVKDMNKILNNNISRNRPSFPLPPPTPPVLPSSPVRPPLPPMPHSDYLVMTAPTQAPKSSQSPLMPRPKKNIKPPEDDDYLIPNDIQENEYEAEPRHNTVFRSQRPPIEIPKDDDFDIPPPPVPAPERENRKNVKVFNLPAPPQEDYQPMDDVKVTKTTPNKDKISPVMPRHNSFSDKIRDSFRKLMVNPKYENVVIVDQVETEKPVPPLNVVILNRPLPPIPVQTEPIHIPSVTHRPLPSLPDDNEPATNSNKEHLSENNSDTNSIEEPIYENIQNKSTSEVHWDTQEIHRDKPEVHRGKPDVHRSKPEVHRDKPEVHKDKEKKIPSHLTGLLANLTKALEKQRFTVGGKDDELRKPLTTVHSPKGPAIIENPSEPEPDEELPEYGNFNLSDQADDNQFYGNVDSASANNTTPHTCSKCKSGDSCSCRWLAGVLEQPKSEKSCSCTKPNCGCSRKNSMPTKPDMPKTDQTKGCGCTKPNCGCSKKPSPPAQNQQDINDDENEYYNTVINLNDEPFYRNTDRKGAKLLLRNLEDGAFLLRPGKMHFLVLTVTYAKKYYNLGIVKTPKNTIKCDCTTDNSLEFANIREFVEYFEQEPLLLQGVNEVVNVKLKPVLK